MDVTPDHARRRLRNDPLARLKAEAYCAVRVFLPHEDNSKFKKGITWALTLAVLPVGVAASFGIAEPPNWFVLLGILWGIAFGRMHDIEINNFAGFEFDYTGGDNGGDDGDE